MEKEMLMKFITYRDGKGEELVGVLSKEGDRAFSLRELGFNYPSMLDLIANYNEKIASAIRDKTGKDAGGVDLKSLNLQAPIPRPRHNIFCVGENYQAHALEGAKYAGKTWTKPHWPIYFSKRVDRCVSPGGFIPSHSDITSRLDYEAELAVIIGSVCSHANPDGAHKHIFGYTVANDVSARDIQLNHAQWMFGKGLDGFAPMGPCLVTADEFPFPPRLAIKCRVNGELRQDSNTSDFIFDIPFMLSQLSSGITLEPGDILITGTPSGVGLGFQPPKFLKAGDVVECEIEGIGILRNTVK
jgi:2-keto-4-pentenoate hydratase/2-oxohepta-3-ene-1,7-dioic acid hydratase in catechol pathway